MPFHDLFQRTAVGSNKLYPHANFAHALCIDMLTVSNGLHPHAKFDVCCSNCMHTHILFALLHEDWLHVCSKCNLMQALLVTAAGIEALTKRLLVFEECPKGTTA